MKLQKEKANYYSTQLSEHQDQSEMWKDRFNQFFTSVADNLCSIFSGALLPKILTPRVIVDFASQEVDINFVYHELLNLKAKKATGLDEIPA